MSRSAPTEAVCDDKPVSGKRSRLSLRTLIETERVPVDEPLQFSAAGDVVECLFADLTVRLTPEAALETARLLERTAQTALRNRRGDALEEDQ